MYNLSPSRGSEAMKPGWVLLRTASVAALSVGALPAAADHDYTPPRIHFPEWYFAVEGGGLFLHEDGNSVDKLGDSDLSAQHKHGFYGGVWLGRRADPSWDWRLGFAYHKLLEANAFGDSETITSNLAFGTLDFEIGYHPSTDDPLLDLRLFAGPRVLHSWDTVDKMGEFFSFNQASTFSGIGPRLGAEFERRLEDSRWGYSGSVAGAAIFGSHHTNAIFDGSSEESATTSATVLNLEAALGVDYRTSTTSKLTVGAHIKKWWNLRPDSLENDVFIDPDVLTWGPFVRFQVDFSPPPPLPPP